MRRTAPGVRVLAAACLVLAHAVGATGAGEGGLPETAVASDAIRHEFGVAVHHDFEPAAFFPESWLRPPVSARGAPLCDEERRRLLPLVRTFLASYPPAMLREHLTDVFLLGELSLFGKPYGATSGRSAVYVKSRCGSAAFTDEYLLGRMHSELSSIFFRRHRFPTEAWSRANPPGFAYLGSGRKMLGRDDLWDQDGRLLEDGFLVRYARSSMENDFNMVVDWLFTRRERLDALCARHERIRAKRDLAIGFYASIDPGLRFAGPETRPAAGRR